MSKREMKVVYQDVDLARVVEYFVKGYERAPEMWDYFVDPMKGRVIIRAYVPADAPPNVPAVPDEA